MARTPVLSPGSPLLLHLLPSTLGSYCRQDVLLFWLWGLWVGEVPDVLWLGYGAGQTMKPRDQLYAEYSLSPGDPDLSPALSFRPQHPDDF